MKKLHLHLAGEGLQMQMQRQRQRLHRQYALPLRKEYALPLKMAHKKCVQCVWARVHQLRLCVVVVEGV